LEPNAGVMSFDVPADGPASGTTVHFTPADLTRVRFGAGPAPLVETALGFAELRYQLEGAVTTSWADRTRRSFPAAARPLLDLIPATGPWPAFLDPALADLDESLEIVTATPRPQLRDELAGTWSRPGRPPTWLRALADGDREALAIVVQALRAFFTACVAPTWPAITTSVRHDLNQRVEVLAESGLEGLFSSLHPDLAWQDGALHRARRSLARAGVAGEAWLDGQGLTIVPSTLWTGPPLFSIDPQGVARSTLIYSARLAAPYGSIGEPADLAALLGRTRAAVLRALCDPCSTAELADRLCISPPSASEHAAALRGANLIQTERRGRAVCHSLTPLGQNLLRGHPGGENHAQAASLPEP
jgi:DNA-binding MarR family transcriptional regulator